jgi:alpha-L-rhamnosidase
MAPSDDAPHGLRVEHLDGALGLRVTSPRLSWRLPTGSVGQLGYRIRTTDGWDTGRVESSASLLVPYGGPAVGSRQRVGWQVKVWTDLGESGWSAPGWFELALDPTDWTAAWIRPPEHEPSPPGERPAHLLRARFDSDAQTVESARLWITALGTYEAFLNGTRIGTAELTPGFTQYDEHLQVQAYDVTSLLRPGANSIGVILADGWYRGQLGMTRASDQWGDRTALLAQLEVTQDDGTTTVIGTDLGWRSGSGHVVAADLIAGERWDLRRLPRGWDEPGFDDSAWPFCEAAAAPAADLVDSPAPPVRRVQEIRPVSVTRLDERRQIVDLGQNINGWTRLSRLGPAGTTVRLVHGEWLGPDGDVTTEHLRPAVPFLPAPLPAGQVDEVISAGVDGDVFEPRRTTHGFQFVRIEDHPDDLSPDDVTGIVVHTDLRRTGWFACSDERINRLHDAAVWSFRDNACDIPTDCPQRERAGWVGDWQLFVPTASFLYDVAGFSAKWLRDLAADQWPDGTISNMSPMPRSEGRDGPIAFLNGSAGWEDAAVIVPWELYRAYGDTRILAELWPTMITWMDKVERTAREQRHPDRVSRRPQPAEHEAYLRDVNFHWGEWLEPGTAVDDFGTFITADKGDVATAYFAYSTSLLARIATVLDKPTDASRYAELSERVRHAWQAEYIGADGSISPDTQANLVRALAFDLVPAELRAAAAERLVQLVREAGTHVGTGFLATPQLLPVLAETGHLDVAYELLFSDTEPSWLTMIDRGATTMWERWDGVRADGTPYESLNHYSKGAVISFLHRHVAGLELPADAELLDHGPAYQRFRVRPQPGGGLTWAESAHESPYGLIETSWRLTDGRLSVAVTVPPGTKAEVLLPDGRRHEVRTGTHRFDADLPTEMPTDKMPPATTTSPRRLR